VRFLSWKLKQAIRAKWEESLEPDRIGNLE